MEICSAVATGNVEAHIGEKKEATVVTLANCSRGCVSASVPFVSLPPGPSLVTVAYRFYSPQRRFWMKLRAFRQVIVDDDLPGIIGFVTEEIKVEDPVHLKEAMFAFQRLPKMPSHVIELARRARRRSKWRSRSDAKWVPQDTMRCQSWMQPGSTSSPRLTLFAVDGFWPGTPSSIHSWLQSIPGRNCYVQIQNRRCICPAPTWSTHCCS